LKQEIPGLAIIPIKIKFPVLNCIILITQFKDKPFRGPDNFKNGDFEYINKIEGTVEKFEGEEIIFYKKQAVYKLSYHGGLIRVK
jgi:hypothetical protein